MLSKSTNHFYFCTERLNLLVTFDNKECYTQHKKKKKKDLSSEPSAGRKEKKRKKGFPLHTLFCDS
jgi:hypothetical protein